MTRTTIEAWVDKFLTRTCEHKGCKLAVCNHARNNLLKAIEAEKLKVQIELLDYLIQDAGYGEYTATEYRDATELRIKSLQQQLDGIEEGE